MDTNEKDELIKELSQVPARNGKRLYSAELKRRILAYAAPHIARGEPQTKIARELGVVSCTLQRWHQDSRRSCDASSKSASALQSSFIPLRTERAIREREGSGGALEVMIRDGLGIRVPIGFDSETLARVVTLFERLTT